jgi:hypothetical protein
MKKVTFTPESAQRIAQAVRRVERLPTQTRGPGLHSPITGGDAFWAEITDEDEGLHSWKKIYPAAAESAGWVDADPAVTGTLNAREANGISAPVATRVLLSFVGYDGDGDPLYQFAIASVRDWFIARISGATQDGTNKRWVYTFVELEKTSAGYNGWADKTSGRTGNCYNLIEDQNGATGTYGNGVASVNLVGTFTVKPCPTGTRIMLHAVDAGGTAEYWFSYENAIDGECP